MRRLRVLGLLLIVAGAAALGQGGWIWAKAQLAQVLLTAAWELRQAGAGPVPPWPWADTAPVARLRVPAHGIDQIVLAGATGRALAFGPGRLDGSAAPGAPGNTVISGHRDTHFRFLRAVAIGTVIELEDAAGKTHRYRVCRTEVVDARRARLRLTGSDARLTLVTCWPFDAVVPGGPMRYLVFAERVPPRV